MLRVLMARVIQFKEAEQNTKVQMRTVSSTISTSTTMTSFWTARVLRQIFRILCLHWTQVRRALSSFPQASMVIQWPTLIRVPRTSNPRKNISPSIPQAKISTLNSKSRSDLLTSNRGRYIGNLINMRMWTCINSNILKVILRNMINHSIRKRKLGLLELIWKPEEVSKETPSTNWQKRPNSTSNRRGSHSLSNVKPHRLSDTASKKRST